MHHRPFLQGQLNQDRHSFQFLQIGRLLVSGSVVWVTLYAGQQTVKHTRSTLFVCWAGQPPPWAVSTARPKHAHWPEATPALTLA